LANESCGFNPHLHKKDKYISRNLSFHNKNYATSLSAILFKF